MKREDIFSLTLLDQESLQVANFQNFRYLEEKLFIITRAINYVSRYNIENIDRYDGMKTVNVFFIQYDEDDEEYYDEDFAIIGVESSEDDDETERILSRYLHFLVTNIS